MQLRNFTITLPAGTSNHGDSHILCVPPRWESVAAFFIGNYLAHAATAKFPPAASTTTKLRIFITVLLMPAGGLVFALQAFAHFIRGIGKSEAQKVAIAGGLCMYARSDTWCPPREVESRAFLERQEFPKPSGLYKYPEFLFCYLQGLARNCQNKSVLSWANALARSLLLYIIANSEGYRTVFRLMSLAKLIEDSEVEREAATQISNGNRLSNVIATIMQRINRPDEDRLALLRVSGERLGQLGRPAIVSPEDVHGTIYNFPGYELVQVPDGVKIFPYQDVLGNEVTNIAKPTTQISSGNNITKGLVALLQLFFSVFTLWRARGNQINTYGYAAFSLSVAPYAVMAVTNLLANTVCREYQTMFLVHNEILEEAERLYGVKVDGCIGRLHQIPESPILCKPELTTSFIFNGSGLSFTASEKEEHQEDQIESARPIKIVFAAEAVKRGILPSQVIHISSHAGYIQDEENDRQWFIADRGSMILGFCLVCAPFAIVGGLSRFEKGSSSTHWQRVAMMLWLVTGQLFGLVSAFLQLHVARLRQESLAKMLFPTARLRLSAENERLCTPDLLARLGLDPWAPNPGFLFYYLRTTVALLSYYYLWPLRLMESIGAVGSALRPDIAVLLGIIILNTVYGFASIWGLIVVGQMINSYGNCIRVY